MDRTHDAEALRQRLIELETALRQPGGISILEERELLAIRQQLDLCSPSGVDAASWVGHAA